MLRTFLAFILTLSLVTVASADPYRYYLGVKGGYSTITGGDAAKFTLQQSFGGVFGVRLADRWLVDIDLSQQRNFNDSTATSSFAFGGDETNATLKWQATRLGLTVRKLLFHPDNRLNLVLGLGGGLMMWDMLDPEGDTVIDVLGSRDELTDFATSEIFFSGGLSLDFKLAPKWSLGWNVQADYLSGAGAEFAAEVENSRNRWQVASFVTLALHFGAPQQKQSWRSDDSWTATRSAKPESLRPAVDSDGDGISDDKDGCPDTPLGTITNEQGCAMDSDGDGINDGLDDCPNTDRAAVGMVDIHGCAVDSDFDGIPDYQDRCPLNPVGAHVDLSGCPIDTDADGVPDGLDDCPNTIYGVKVDRFGCIDLSLLSQPLVLNIDYAPGSFEVDPRNQARLKELARVLLFVPDIRLEINGYTDNIGTESANMKLSEKRALRVRDFLAAAGVAGERIKVFGKGESNFVATNDTTEGRARNRRIEIIFFK